VNDRQLREKAASALLSLEKQVKELQEKLANASKRNQCEKIAHRMVEKGILENDIESYLIKVAELSQLGDPEIEKYQAAVEIAVHGLNIGEAASQEKVADVANDPVESLILREMMETS
jgi:uncharacterized protein YjgD (DUF1641 family)